ncbi:8416_t:CDS:10 [Paraglomus brasilianum]|uniref:8416_t:CDS:1 n=1 Tax=Paraglomus brasilianum TaxID=144538 RepID=A0A9N9AW22_9GLOM|nr:8416_t:CDS:10 [Paraglomus brasilianum]
MSSAANVLAKQFKELSTNPVPGFTVALHDDNVFEWDVGIIGAPATIYEGGYFKATMKFPKDYPFNPPTFKFNNSFFHPNVYADGNLCISILHPPVDDPTSGETAEERWNPTQTVESILISIVSLLADPNCSSPANVDAGVMYRKNKEQYDSIVRAQVESSKKDIPAGLKIPTNADEFVPNKPKPEIDPDDDFWLDDEDMEEEMEDDMDSGDSSEEEYDD